jgi:hypothetical protein
VKKLDGRKHAFIDGVEVVTTSEISRLLGLTLSVNQIREFSDLSPIAQINAATYWKTSDIPAIAAMVSSRLAVFAANFQLLLNLEKSK